MKKKANVKHLFIVENKKAHAADAVGAFNTFLGQTFNSVGVFYRPWFFFSSR